jgi:AhpD family alkylhydroperoxidase
MGEYKELLASLRAPTKSLREAIPEAWAGFGALHENAVSDGALPAKVKEMTAVAIAVATGCDGCIGYHTRAAARKGATSEEFAEMLAVALLMAGGPASIYAPKAWSAWEEFTDRQPS